MDDPAIPISELRYYLDGTEKSLADPSKARYKDNNQKMRDALKAEISKREKPALPPSKVSRKLVEEFKAVCDKAKDVAEFTKTYKSTVLQATTEDEQNEIMALYNVRYKELTGAV